jgi:polysaccharide export outer membrane protein
MGNGSGHARQLLLATLGVIGLAFLAATTGCQDLIVPPANAPAHAPADATKKPDVLTVQEGDVLKISFPGAQNLDTQQQVRRDGRITMSMIGEVIAAGLTPAELEQELLKQYSSQLVSKEVSVTVISSAFAVYVNGAVLRPGKIMSDRPISALQAVMEAGGFDNAKADTKAVVIIRQEGGQTKNYPINLKLVLEGKSNEPFFLKASDIVYVPEKFSWF